MFSKKSILCNHYRLSDVIIIICVPASIILGIYVTLLCRDLQNISIDPTNTIGEIEDNEAIVYKLSVDIKDDVKLDDVKEEIKTEKPQPIIHLKYNENSPKVGPPLNNTGKGSESILFLTSIERSGHSTLKEILKKLKTPNEFIIISPPLTSIKLPSVPSSKQMNIVRNTEKIKKRSVIFSDFAVIDFSEFEGTQPIEIAMVRDPTERMISKYYAARIPFKVVDEYNRNPNTVLPSKRFLRKSIEACLFGRIDDKECKFKPGNQIKDHTLLYFCGQDDMCKNFSDEEVLEMAKRNVIEKFSVVGVLEDLEKTLVVLEHYIPQFFRGAYDTYFDILKNINKKFAFNHNMYKPTVEKSARELIEMMLSVEYKFYNFLRDRLNQQYEEIINSNHFAEYE